MTSGSDIKYAQRLLHLEPTGIINELTRAALRNYQLRNQLDVTGELDITTTESMFVDEVDLSTDLTERYTSFIQDYHLPSGEYIEQSTAKEYLFLHHTAGWNNPYNVVDMWANDRRGRIGTHYVIGGINPRTGDTSYDGTVLRCIDDQYYAWHLGKVDRYMHKHSIGIEICNFGWLVKRKGGFYTYTNTKVRQDQVVDLGYNFRGYRYWHRYSNEQLSALRNLIIHITDTHGISTYLGLQERLGRMSPRDAFEYYEEARYGEVKGILSHTSVRPDKFDVFPQDELVDMILSI
jgi:hypothetical protein